MTAYVALFRGVNLIGKSTLKMADLKAIADELKLEKARTYIASGNLLFVSDKPEDKLREMLEERMQAHMGKQVRVILRTAKEMAAIVRANPFPEGRGNNVQAFFMNKSRRRICSKPSVTGPMTSASRRAKREVFVAYGEKGIGRSRIRIPAAEAGTARNMNTVAKLAELAKEME